MGLFQESKDYGGEQTVVFNQGHHPFITDQKKILNETNKARYAGVINNGVCAASSLNWLEFYADNPGGQYDIKALDNTQIATRIVETQVFLVDNNSSLHQILSQFGPKEIKKNLAFKEEPAQCLALLSEPGIKTISFQSQDASKSHSAVAIVTEEKSESIFTLFDSFGGEVRFKISEQILLQEKNPVTWLDKYFKLYREKISDPKLKIMVNTFENSWVSKGKRDAFIEEMAEHNKKTQLQKKLPAVTDEKLSTPTSRNLYGTFHQPHSSIASERSPSPEPTSTCKSSCIVS